MLLTHVHSWRRYIVLPFYPLTLKSHFQRYIDAIVAAPSDEAAAALLPDEREVLLLLVQLCAALVHLQQHHVVHRDFKVGILGCCGCASLLLTHTLTRHPALPGHHQKDNIFIDSDGRVKVGDFGEVGQPPHVHLSPS